MDNDAARSLAWFILARVLAIAPSAAGKAQTINGESTYENNYYHAPPGGVVPRHDAIPETIEDDAERSRGRLHPNDRGEDHAKLAV